MRLIIILLIISFYFLKADENKNLLILNSYHKGFEVSDKIINNIEKVFYTREDINIDILYMDSKQINTREYISELRDLYTLQLKNRKFDLIITIDQFAYNFAVKNYSNLFHGEPILFTGIEQFSKELAKIYNLNDKIYGIIQKRPIKDNLDLIFKMIPDLKKLYILNDRSLNGNDTSPFIIKAIGEIKNKYNIEIEYLRDDTLKEFKNNFKDYKKDEAILFVRFANDSNGDFYKTNEIVSALNEFNLPIFVTDSLFIDKGALGGKVISIENIGLNTGYKALDLINKKNILEPISVNKNYKYIFDDTYLKKYHLNIPSDVNHFKLINAPIGFFDTYRVFINTVFLASPILLVVIFGLLQALHSKQLSERKLKHRIEFDKVLLNAIDAPIFWQDKNGKILDANTKFCELINLSYEVIEGNTLDAFYHTYFRVRKVVNSLEKYSAEKIEDHQLVMRDKKGKKRIYFINQTTYESSSYASGVVTIFTDITKEKEIEIEKLKHTQYMIQQSKLAEIGEIFSSIAHQWKSPLVAITALAQDLFYSNNSSEKEEDSYHINNIMVQAQYMTNTIDEFQDFIIPSKQKTNFNVHETIKAMLNIVKHNLKYNYINVKINVEENTKLMVYGYENEFMQAILNLINNAKDALLNNNEKNRNIIINLKTRDEYLVFDIIDNGPGIKKESVDKIFLQYYSTKENGHGIGLYMTKLIIEDKMCGKIKFKHIHSGSCFRIKLNYI